MIKLKTIAELTEHSLARMIYPVADKKGEVTLRTIKVTNEEGEKIARPHMQGIIRGPYKKRYK